MSIADAIGSNTMHKSGFQKSASCDAKNVMPASTQNGYAIRICESRFSMVRIRCRNAFSDSDSWTGSGTADDPYQQRNWIRRKYSALSSWKLRVGCVVYVLRCRTLVIFINPKFNNDIPLVKSQFREDFTCWFIQKHGASKFWKRMKGKCPDFSWLPSLA